MKALLVLASVFLFSSAHADYVHYGRILFQSASTYVPANKVCRDGGFLYHKNKDFIKVTTCKDDGGGCKSVMKKLEQPVNSTRPFCKKWSDSGCKKWTTKALNQGTVKVSVYDSYKEFEDGARPDETYSYTVDRCNN